MEKLELGQEDVYKVDGIINPADLMDLRDADETGKMNFEKWEHFYPADLPEEDGPLKRIVRAVGIPPPIMYVT